MQCMQRSSAPTACTCEKCESVGGVADEVGGAGVGVGCVGDGSTALHRELTAEALHCDAAIACLPLTCKHTYTRTHTRRHRHTFYHPETNRETVSQSHTDTNGHKQCLPAFLTATALRHTFLRCLCVSCDLCAEFWKHNTLTAPGDTTAGLGGSKVCRHETRSKQKSDAFRKP